jgi:hypothetical protein
MKKEDGKVRTRRGDTKRKKREQLKIREGEEIVK